MRGFITEDRCISKRRFVVEEKPVVEEVKKKEPNPMQTKSYKEFMKYIYNNEWLKEHEEVRDSLLVWYEHMKPRVTLGMMVNNLITIYREVNGDAEEIRKSIQNASDHGWFKFYKYKEPYRKTGQDLADAHGGGAYQVEKDYDDKGVEY